MENIELTAYVLKSARVSDTKWRLSLFSAEKGLLNVVMHCPKNSRLTLGLTPFIALWFDILVYPYGYAVRAVEPIDTEQFIKSFSSSNKNTALFASWYVNELILALLPKEEGDLAVYKIYKDTIENLKFSLDKVTIEACLCRFEWGLIKSLGYINLPRETSPYLFYQFIPARGLIKSVNGIKGNVLLALEKGDLLAGDMLPSAKRLTKSLLDFVLDGRVLKAKWGVNALLI
ncbi:MAG: hypothetical protein A3F18_06360 [Legionellales bacterium RIFCSPHIGHO2_12_FULL_37_14]|nr:MAG: hypothetical protein A3F18_06360 [Legionellales bacterium RIFCSPHIGHO2_12_FULL_37_14]